MPARSASRRSTADLVAACGIRPSHHGRNPEFLVPLVDRNLQQFLDIANVISLLQTERGAPDHDITDSNLNQVCTGSE